MLDLTCISLLIDTCWITATVIWTVFFVFCSYCYLNSVFCSWCYWTSFLLLLCSAQGSLALVQETPRHGRKRTGSKRMVQLPSSLLLSCPHHWCPRSQSALPVPVSFLSLLSPFTVSAGCPLGTEICCFTDSLNLNWNVCFALSTGNRHLLFHWQS